MFNLLGKLRYLVVDMPNPILRHLKADVSLVTGDCGAIVLFRIAVEPEPLEEEKQEPEPVKKQPEALNIRIKTQG